jgi:hypothetical protein
MRSRSIQPNAEQAKTPLRPIRRLTLPALSALLLLICSLATADDPPDYLGSGACGECHKRGLLAWRGSHHDRAMAEPTDGMLLGDFSDQTHRAQAVIDDARADHSLRVLAPERAGYACVQALAKQQTGDLAGALRVLERARDRLPRDRELLVDLAPLDRDVGGVSAALPHARELAALDRNDANAAARMRGLPDAE